MRSDDLLRACFEHADIGLSLTDLEGRLLAVNPAYCGIIDCTETELRLTADFRTLTHPEDLATAEMVRALKAGEIPAFTLEGRYIRKDGSIVWVRHTISLIRDDNGCSTHFVQLTEDITEYKQLATKLHDVQARNEAMCQSEERYRELFENSKDALYLHDMSGRYTSVNRAAERLSGYTREELIGRHFSNFVPAEYANHVREQLCKKLETAGETTYEVEMIMKSGQRIPVEVSSRLIVENGLPVSVQGCVRDISERKRAQEASRTYSRKLIEAQEAERRRISLELHDQVGQVLTAVKMNLHALQKACAQPEILKSIQENLSVIDEAADQVRDLSVALRPALLDDFGLVVAVRWYLERQSKNTGVAAEFVSLSLDEDDRFTAELETACFRIVQEGVTNIIRHARASRLSVRLERTGADLMLVIADDGCGFNVKTTLADGHGLATLGLRGMEERAQAVGGTLLIDSAPGRGTQVCATLPVALDKPAVEQVRAPVAWVRI
ncbi:MAG TPA: PAS domain S-box protein [Pyrinomonadaceae bacterium]|nr:PAS domain S-box protein [Pyrinomonadaceae bacterium]